MMSIFSDMLGFRTSFGKHFFTAMRAMSEYRNFFHEKWYIHDLDALSTLYSTKCINFAVILPGFQIIAKLYTLNDELNNIFNIYKIRWVHLPRILKGEKTKKRFTVLALAFRKTHEPSVEKNWQTDH